MTEPTCPHCGTPLGVHEHDWCLDEWVTRVVFGSGNRHFHPSENMLDAWHVVEHLRERGWMVDLRSPGFEAEWQVSLCRREWVTDYLAQSRPLPMGMAETGPLAICRAAIVALEEPARASGT